MKIIEIKILDNGTIDFKSNINNICEIIYFLELIKFQSFNQPPKIVNPSLKEIKSLGRPNGENGGKT